MWVRSHKRNAIRPARAEG